MSRLGYMGDAFGSVARAYGGGWDFNQSTPLSCPPGYALRPGPNGIDVCAPVMRSRGPVQRRRPLGHLGDSSTADTWVFDDQGNVTTVSTPTDTPSSDPSGGGSSVDWTSVVTGLVQAGSQIAQTAIKAGAGQPTGSGTSGYIGNRQTQGGGAGLSISPTVLLGGGLLLFMLLK